MSPPDQIQSKCILLYEEESSLHTINNFSWHFYRMENDFRTMRHMEYIKTRRHTSPMLWSRWVLKFKGRWQHTGKAIWTLQTLGRSQPQKANYHASVLHLTTRLAQEKPVMHKTTLPQTLCDTSQPAERNQVLRLPKAWQHQSLPITHHNSNYTSHCRKYQSHFFHSLHVFTLVLPP